MVSFMFKEVLWQKRKAMSDLKYSSALNYAAQIIFMTALFMNIRGNPGWKK